MSTVATIDQYLTFLVGKEIFALDIVSVREVLELSAITRVPRTPVHMRGVVNLRGNAVPVVDMRLKLGMQKTQDTVDSCIIIVELMDEGESTIIGTVVDGVREVIEITSDSIEVPPRTGAAVDSDYILGMSRQDGRFVVLLEIAKLFSTAELSLAKEISEDKR